MKKTYIQESINHETGEILTTTSFYQTTNRDGGKYGLFDRDTCWYKDLTAVSEFKIMYQLLNHENQHTNLINIDKKIKEKICQTIELSEKQFENTIRSLIKKDKLKRLRKGVYMLNPEYMWIGNVKNKTNKINIYNNC